MLWCSVGAFHSRLLMTLVVTNIRKFIGCHMVLHVSTPRMKMFNRADITFNPTSFHVTRGGPEVLHLHISNLELILRNASAQDKIIILPGNAIFFKNCLSEVEKFDMTFLDDFYDNDDHAFHNDRYFAPFYNYLSRNPDPVLAIHPLARIQHEGTFYKAHHLQKILSLVKKSSIFTHCPVRPCTLEETMIPTLMWQYFPNSIRNYTLPLIHRHFEWNISAIIDNHPSVCGRKFVHDPNEAHTIRELKRINKQF